MHKLLVIKNGNAHTSIVKILNNLIDKKESLKNIITIELINSKDNFFVSLDKIKLDEYIKKYIGIIILGGTDSVIEIKKNKNLIQVLNVINICIKYKINLLGICLGCQLIAYNLGYEIYRLDEPYIGYNYKTTITEKGKNDQIFKNFNFINNLLSFHTDAIKINPNYNKNQLDILGISNNNIPYIIKHKYAPIYGVQFHPEINIDILYKYLDMKLNILFDKNTKNFIISQANKQKNFNLNGLLILQNWLFNIKF